MFDDFEKDPLSAEGLDHHVSTVQLEQYCNSHVLLKYASEWWTKHLKSSLPERQMALIQTTARLCDVRSRRCWTWLRVKRFAEDDYQPSGFTDLILACDLGLIDLVKYVLSKGVDVNARDKEGATALNRAVSEGSVDVARTLLNYGADVEAGDWDTPWREVSENGSVRNEKIFTGRPLMHATINEDHTMMQELLAAGADLEARSKFDSDEGQSALHFTTMLGEEEQTMRILLDHGADVNARVGESDQFHTVTRQQLLESKYDFKIFGTALETAVGQDDAAKVGLLLSFGADPVAEIHINGENDEMQSSLHSDDPENSVWGSVCETERQETPESPTVGEDIEYISAASSSRVGSFGGENGSKSEMAPVNEAKSPNQAGKGHGAPEVDSDQAIAISRDLAVGRPAFDRKTPPRQILEEWERTTKAISKLTVFHYAISRGVEDVVRLFLQHGAARKPASLAPAEPTALHLATLLGSSQVVSMIIDHTVNVNPKDLEERTPLHLAVWCGYDRKVNVLLEHGADPNAKDYEGLTPLHIAISTNYDLVVKDLLDHGADIHVEDKNGVSPQQLAKAEGIDQSIKLLLNSEWNKQRKGYTTLDLAMNPGEYRAIQR